jgi:hypothetical protein
MSDWQGYDFEGKLIAILQSDEFSTSQMHHFGRPFVSAYQLAVAFERAHPDLCRELGKVIGEVGESRDNLARYLANQLSRHIQSRGEDYPIEGAWLSAEGLTDLCYRHVGVTRTGQPNTEYNGFSLFRLRE